MVEIYTDGSCLKNPDGPSGSGAVLIYKNNAKILSFGLGNSTNNRAELMAIYKSLEIIKESKRHYPIKIYTDSRYAIGVLTGKMKASKNLDIITETRSLLLKFPEIEFEWVKGHNGNKWNEVADKLALRASRSPKNSLFTKLFNSLDDDYFKTL